MLFPFEFPGENGNENNNKNQRQQEDPGVKIRSTGHHTGSFVPSGKEIDANRDNKKERYRDSEQKLPESAFLLFAVLTPVCDKGFFFIAEHLPVVLMELREENIEQKLRFLAVYG
jgi:hypothetical protein